MWALSCSSWYSKKIALCSISKCSLFIRVWSAQSLHGRIICFRLTLAGGAQRSLGGPKHILVVGNDGVMMSGQPGS